MKRILHLYRIKVLSPKGIFQIVRGLLHEGKNMNLLLYFSAKMYPQQTAIQQEGRHLNYAQLHQKVSNLAAHIAQINKLNVGNRAAILAKNSIETTIALFALSRIGVDVYLLNPEMSLSQLKKTCFRHKIDFIIYDNDQHEKVSTIFSDNRSIPLTENASASIEQLMHQTSHQKIGKRKAGNVVVLTGGTTGDFKTADRQQSISNFLHPLVALIDQVQLNAFQSVYIPTPIYHGFGLAALTISILLGKEIHLTKGFNAKSACSLIERENIDVVTLVPIMLHRMLNENPASLKNLKRILSGGATLDPRLVSKSAKLLGPKLYNLYGTSEVGFCVLGLPEDLISNPTTIGKPINGVQFRINSKEAIGMLEIKCNWAMKSQVNKWSPTGDLATIDANKLVYLKGRSDRMIVSGGENVYPKDLEDLLYLHEYVDLASVIGIPDEAFGQRLKAFVKLTSNQAITETELLDWLKPRVARYQLPAKIEFVDAFPLTSIGKVDLKALN